MNDLLEQFGRLAERARGVQAPPVDESDEVLLRLARVEPAPERWPFFAVTAGYLLASSVAVVWMIDSYGIISHPLMHFFICAQVASF